jgi:hypothetical protein
LNVFIFNFINDCVHNNCMVHIDGPSDDAKFSTDFEVRYSRSSCSLLVIDRGNQEIREIPLHDDDCAYQDEFGFPLGTLYLSFYLTKN